MNPVTIGLIGIGILIVLMFGGVYISVSMALVGFIGTILIAGSIPALANMYIIPFGTVNDFTFAVLPLFILMGELINFCGIARGAYEATRAWVGQLRGGLAMASVAACGLFAATSGSSMATAVVMGRVAYPEMKRFNYASTLASGCLAAGGSVGVMIPPSLPFVLIGVLTDTSIGRLFIAGILPGITEILFYMITIFIMCRINPSLGPKGPNIPFKQKVSHLGNTWPIAVVFLIVVGGIYGGVFTPTEAGAIGVIGVLLIGLGTRKLSRSGFTTSLSTTVRMAGMMTFLLISAFILNNFLAVSRLPFVTSEFIVHLGLNRYVVLGAILILYIILGCFFDIIPIIVLTVPILFPVIEAMGFNPVWYGVLMVRIAEMGFVTPPLGINMFVLSGVIGIPVGTIYRGVLPFVIADCFHIAFLVAVPEVALFLPNIMRG